MVEACLSKKYPNKTPKAQITSVWKLMYTQEFTESGSVIPSLPLFPGQTPKSLGKTWALFLKSLCTKCSLSQLHQIQNSPYLHRGFKAHP